MINQEKNTERLKEWCIDKTELIDNYEVQYYFRAWHWAAALCKMLLIILAMKKLLEHLLPCLPEQPSNFFRLQHYE